MSQIHFRVAARTDVGLIRANNEDNFHLSASVETPAAGWEDCEYELSRFGALLVVADGMGGMNAGEVASEIAIETVRQHFAIEHINQDTLRSRFSIEKFMNDAITEADAQIKRRGAIDKQSQGMGTTIVIGWVLDGKLYVSWCGDSRAYIYNPANGIHQITKDHSYVQQLVDKGAISREEAFDFPDSNIITRSLSDAGPKAKASSLLHPIQLADGDIVFLCTDGVSGMMRDEEMEQIIRQHETNIDDCAASLISGALSAGGHDNATICMLQVVSGGTQSQLGRFDDTDAALCGPKEKKSNQSINDTVKNDNEDGRKQKKWKWLFLIGLPMIFAGIVLFFCLSKKAALQQTQDELLVETEPMVDVEMKGTVDAIASSEVKAEQGNSSPEKTKKETLDTNSFEPKLKIISQGENPASSEISNSDSSIEDVPNSVLRRLPPYANE